MALFDIIINLTTNTAALEAGLSRVESRLNSFANVAKSAFSALGVAELVRFTEQAMAAGAAMEHAIQISGASAEGFQRLAYVAGATGVSAESLATAMSRMGTNLSKAGSDAKAQREALEALGVSFSALKELKPEEQFIKLGEQIAALRNPMDQDRASTALFGRAFQELLPIFKMASDRFKELHDSAPIFTEQQLAQLEKGDQAIKRIHQSVSMFGSIIASNLADPLERFAKTAADLASGRESAGQFFEDFMHNFYEAAKVVSGVNPEAGLANFDRARAGLIQRQPTPSKYELGGMMPEIVGIANRPPGYPSALSQLTGIDVSKIPAKLPLQDMGVGYGAAELKATQEAYKTIAEITEELQAGAITQRQFDDLLDEALDKWHSISDVIQPIEVKLHHMTEPLSDAQILARGLAEDFSAAYGAALSLGGNFGENFVRMLLQALENRAILAAVENLANMMRGVFENTLSGGGGGGGFWGGLLSGLVGAFVPAGAGGGIHLSSGSGPTGGGGYTGGTWGSELGRSYVWGPAWTPWESQHSVSRGQVYAPVYNIDARGADADRVMTMLPPLLAQTAERAKRDVLESFRRHGLAAPRTA